MLCGTFLWALYFKQNPGFLMEEDAFRYLTTLKCPPLEKWHLSTYEQTGRGTLCRLLRTHYFSQESFGVERNCCVWQNLWCHFFLYVGVVVCTLSVIPLLLQNFNAISSCRKAKSFSVISVLRHSLLITALHICWWNLTHTSRRLQGSWDIISMYLSPTVLQKLLWHHVMNIFSSCQYSVNVPI